MLEVQKFIRENENWREILSKEPYGISISEDTMFGRDLVLLKYSQMNSDFSLEIVKECRGLILDAHTYEIVCYPFYKFFNYGEPQMATIDWSSAFVESKLDGSIIKIVRLGDDFLISTNGVIDAWKCNLENNLVSPFKTFGELVMEGFHFYGITMDDFPRLFKEGFTYIFELTSPWNQVVVKWDETKMNFIGVRDNNTLKESFYFDHELSKVFNTPKIYNITSIEECIQAAKELPENNEGYVVCDRNFNRIKVKSPIYIQLHYMANNQCWSPSRVLDIFRANEVSEYVAYFPMFKVAFDRVKESYDAWIGRFNGFKDEMVEFLATHGENRKELAKWCFSDDDRTRKQFSGFAFAWLDNKVKTVDEYVAKIPTSKLVEILGLKQ